MTQPNTNQVSLAASIDEDACNTNVSSPSSTPPLADAQRTLSQPHEPWKVDPSSRNTRPNHKPPARPLSISASETVCDDELNAIMAEGWSVPTYTESDVDEIVQTAEKFHLTVHNTQYNVLEEDHALSQVPSLSPTLLQSQTFGSGIVAPVLSPIKRDCCDPWPDRRTLDTARDLHAIGTKWQDELRMSNLLGTAHSRAIPQTLQSYIVECDNPAVAAGRLSFLLSALDPTVHPRTANNFFNGLDLVLGSLASRFPDDVVVLGLVDAVRRLDRLCIVNFDHFSMSVDQWASPNANITSTPRVTPTEEGRTSFSDSSGVAPSRTSGNDTPNSSTPNAPLRSSPDNPSDPTIEHVPRKKRKRARGRLLACPVRKNCQLRLVESSCNFTGADTMWAITQHLNSRRHQHDVAFVRLCRVCWTYVTSVTEYDIRHNHGRCLQATQPRGHRVEAQWYSLYLKLYPYAAQLPSPYVDETTTRPAEPDPNRNAFLIEPLPTPEFDFNGISSDQSFLDVHPRTLHDGIQQMAPLSQSSYIDVRQQAEASAIALFTQMLSEHVHEPHDLMNHHMGQFTGSANYMNADDIDAFADRFYAQANGLVHRLRNQGNQGRVRNYFSTPQDPVLGPNDFWIGHFPTPLRLQAPLPPEPLPQLDPPTASVILQEHIPPAEPWAFHSSFGLETGLASQYAAYT
ncbi:hypothetical protein FB567DRAFT_596717 [Paraphoma chrysanthemicola]|uniref:Uncharacterized protein n=1 Tax=Paraphoma chrysanthemicola TaxID=798071 RepID=A0A8K0QXS3_9PLEO|nr:hypothetical protein FB567DRAFT_596717 [Paraphoma chrysanthemicola]